MATKKRSGEEINDRQILCGMGIQLRRLTAGTHQKIIDMAMNGVGCRATARIMGVGLNTIFRHLKNSGRSR